ARSSAASALLSMLDIASSLAGSWSGALIGRPKRASAHEYTPAKANGQGVEPRPLRQLPPHAHRARLLRLDRRVCLKQQLDCLPKRRRRFWRAGAHVQAHEPLDPIACPLAPPGFARARARVLGVGTTPAMFASHAKPPSYLRLPSRAAHSRSAPTRAARRLAHQRQQLGTEGIHHPRAPAL